MEGGKLFVVVGGEGVVVLAGLLCVACYQTRTSARTRVDSAHLSRRRAIPSFLLRLARRHAAGRPASDRSTPLHGRSRDLSPPAFYSSRSGCVPSPQVSSFGPWQPELMTPYFRRQPTSALNLRLGRKYTVPYRVRGIIGMFPLQFAWEPRPPR